MPFYGESVCMDRYKNGKPCKNQAYYAVTTSLNDSRFVCGQHRGKYPRFTTLLEDPNKKEKQEQKRVKDMLEVEDHAAKNREMKKSGNVICTGLKMMKNPEHYEGYLKVFPNFKHQNRKDGFGCASLSPKSMGPVVHPQPGLPTAFNLENFWQFSKVFPDEVDEKGVILPIFFERQITAFLDKIPHRHKPNATGNIPLYSVWKRPDGSLVKYKYIKARQFYCHYYERFALQNKDFQTLKEYLKTGHNLQICGYDAYPVTESLEKHYLDDSRPFGHELVLYALLTVDDPENYPWRKYKTEEY